MAANLTIAMSHRFGKVAVQVPPRTVAQTDDVGRAAGSEPDAVGELLELLLGALPGTIRRRVLSPGAAGQYVAAGAVAAAR